MQIYQTVVIDFISRNKQKGKSSNNKSTQTQLYKENK
jgi:hypothetical protein